MTPDDEHVILTRDAEAAAYIPLQQREPRTPPPDDGNPLGACLWMTIALAVALLLAVWAWWPL